MAEVNSRARSERGPRRQVSFRLEARYTELIDRWAADLAKKEGRHVTRAETVRAILTCAQRADRRAAGEDLPEISDSDLLNLPDVKR